MILAGETDTLTLGARLASVLRVGDVVALSGPLGGGKTTLARGCLHALGYTGEVASPTFTIVQAYEADPPSGSDLAELIEAPYFRSEEEETSPLTSSGKAEVGRPVLAILHVDLYRLNAPDEADELGLDDALADHALLIEWPERLGDRLWPHALRLALEVVGSGARRLTAQAPAAWAGRWPLPE